MGTELIKLIIEHGPNAITTNGTATATTMTSIVECPHEKVGRIIGSKGDTIKELQSRTGSRVQIQDKNLPDGEPRKVKVIQTTNNKQLTYKCTHFSIHLVIFCNIPSYITYIHHPLTYPLFSSNDR